MKKSLEQLGLSQQEMELMEKICNGDTLCLDDIYTDDHTTPLWEELERLQLIRHIEGFRWEVTSKTKALANPCEVVDLLCQKVATGEDSCIDQCTHCYMLQIDL